MLKAKIQDVLFVLVHPRAFNQVRVFKIDRMPNDQVVYERLFNDLNQVHVPLLPFALFAIFEIIELCKVVYVLQVKLRFELILDKRARQGR